jgi:hypothetical protein
VAPPCLRAATAGCCTGRQRGKAAVPSSGWKIVTASAGAEVWRAIRPRFELQGVCCSLQRRALQGSESRAHMQAKGDK